MYTVELALNSPHSGMIRVMVCKFLIKITRSEIRWSTNIKAFKKKMLRKKPVYYNG